MHSVKTVVTHFRLLRSSPNSDTRNFNCCIEHRHRPLLDSVGKGFQLKEKKGNVHQAMPTRTMVERGSECSVELGRVKAAAQELARPYCPFSKVIFCLAAHVKAICSGCWVGLRSHHKSIHSLKVRVKSSRDDVFRAALSRMFCSASEYNCCRVHRADGQVK